MKAGGQTALADPSAAQPFDECRRFAFGPRKSLGLDFPGWIFMASTPFSVSQENSIRIAAMCCLTVGGAA
jgi:hypothetical protein